MTIGVLVKPASNELSLEGKFGETVLLAKRLLIDENFVPTFWSRVDLRLFWLIFFCSHGQPRRWRRCNSWKEKEKIRKSFFHNLVFFPFFHLIKFLQKNPALSKMIIRLSGPADTLGFQGNLLNKPSNLAKITPWKQFIEQITQSANS